MTRKELALHLVSADLASLACGLVVAEQRLPQRAQVPVLDLSGEQWLEQGPSRLPDGLLRSYAALPYALSLWERLEPRLEAWLELLQQQRQARQLLLIPPLPGVDLLLRCLCLAEALEQNPALTVLLPAPAEALALLELARTGPDLVEALLDPLLLWWDQTRQTLASLEVVLRLRLPASASLRLEPQWRGRLQRMAELLAPDGAWQLTLALECADPEARLLRHRLSCASLRGFVPSRIGLHGPAAAAVLAERPPWWPEQLLSMAIDPAADARALQTFLRQGPPPAGYRVDGARGLLRLHMPGLSRSQLDVRQIGSVVVLISAGHRHLVNLPAIFQGQQCSGARVENGWLELRFS